MTRNRSMVVLIMITFFVISLLTNILGPIVPDIINSFHLSLTAAAFLAFAFFIAHGVMSIPAEFLVERLGEKSVMIAAFSVGAAGSLCFALVPQYRVAVVSYFVIGAGMAVLQVAINPLLRVSGGEDHYAFNSALAQFVFGAASFVSPWICSYLVVNLGKPAQPNLFLKIMAALTPEGLPWASIYGMFSSLTLIMIVMLAFIRFPPVEYNSRRECRVPRCVRWSAAKTPCMDVLRRDDRLRGQRAGNRGLDFEIPLAIPWASIPTPQGAL